MLFSVGSKRVVEELAGLEGKDGGVGHPTVFIEDEVKKMSLRGSLIYVYM